VTSVGQADILTRGLGWVFGDGDGDGSGFYSPPFLLARQCSNNKSVLFDNAANLHERAKGGEGNMGLMVLDRQELILVSHIPTACGFCLRFLSAAWSWIWT